METYVIEDEHGHVRILQPISTSPLRYETVILDEPAAREVLAKLGALVERLWGHQEAETGNEPIPAPEAYRPIYTRPIPGTGRIDIHQLTQERPEDAPVYGWTIYDEHDVILGTQAAGNGPNVNKESDAASPEGVALYLLECLSSDAEAWQFGINCGEDYHFSEAICEWAMDHAKQINEAEEQGMTVTCKFCGQQPMPTATMAATWATSAAGMSGSGPPSRP